MSSLRKSSQQADNRETVLNIFGGSTCVFLFINVYFLIGSIPQGLYLIYLLLLACFLFMVYSHFPESCSMSSGSYCARSWPRTDRLYLLLYVSSSRTVRIKSHFLALLFLSIMQHTVKRLVTRKKVFAKHDITSRVMWQGYIDDQLWQTMKNIQNARYRSICPHPFACHGAAVL